MKDKSIEEFYEDLYNKIFKDEYLNSYIFIYKAEF